MQLNPQERLDLHNHLHTLSDEQIQRLWDSIKTLYTLVDVNLPDYSELVWLELVYRRTLNPQNF